MSKTFNLNIILFLITICLSFSGISQALVINEIMSSNATTIHDEDFDYEDWIELFNGTDSVINLESYKLSDDFSNPDRWVFPEVTINPGEFLLIFASGKDRYGPGYLHTNFSISKAGEPVLLSNANGQIIDYIPPVFIATDVSYGRYPDGGTNFYFFDPATPGSENNTSNYNQLLQPVIFNKLGGFYKNEIYLELFHQDPGVTIIYTLDGSEPDINNLDGMQYLYKNDYAYHPEDDFGEFLTDSFYSLAYNSPIHIINRDCFEDKLTGKSSTMRPENYTPLSPVTKGTVVRAKAFKPGALSKTTETHTYFIDPQGRSKYSLPVISIATQEDNLFDYYNGIYTAGIVADEWRIDNPDEELPGYCFGNFVRRGIETEIPAHFEFFDNSSTTADFCQDVGIRLHGGLYTRSHPLKTFRIYARSRYGNKYLEYPFFHDYDYDSFKRLLLRNSGNDYWNTLFRDAAIQISMKDMNFETQAYLPTSVFVNGENWGILNIRERYDKHYFLRVFGIEEHELDYLSNWEVKEGNATHWVETINYIKHNDIRICDHYQHIKTKIDIDNFIDYHIAHIYANNFDWPHNNNDRFRKKTENYDPEAPHGQDGRWRWVLYDMDFGFNMFDDPEAYNFNMLEFATDPNKPEWATFLIINLLENSEFRQKFIDRFEFHLLNTFDANRIVGIIDSVAAIIQPELHYHSHRWRRGTVTVKNWGVQVNIMRNFAKKRPCAMRNMIMDFFNIQDSAYAAAVCNPGSHVYPVTVSRDHLNVSVFPVPAKDYLIVCSGDHNLISQKMTIHDMSGRIVRKIDRKQNLRNGCSLDIHNLNPGFYILVIETPDNIIKKNFAVMH